MRVPYESVEGDNEDLIDILGILNIIRRRLWTLLAVSALVFTAVVLYTAQSTPLFTATTKVALELQRAQIVDFDAVLTGAPPDSATVDTEVEVLGSRTLAGAVVDELGLMGVAEFNPALREPGSIDRLRGSVSSVLATLLPSQPVEAAGEAISETSREIARDHVITALLNQVEISRRGVSYLIDLSVTSESPRLAREIANTYAEQYLVAQLEEKFSATQRANEWLNSRVETLREEVRVKEAAVAEFREQNGLLDAQGATLTEQQISDVNAQLVLQRAALAEAEARLRAVRRQVAQGVSAETISEVLLSDTIRDLRAQQADTNRRQSELGTRYGPRHPQMITIQQEIADLDRQIAREVDRIVASLANEVEVARGRVSSLDRSLGQLRRELGNNYASVVRLRELEREAEASRVLFQSILARFQQTSEQESLAQSDSRIVSYAALPTAPSSPNVELNLALGAILAIGTGLLVIFMMEMLVAVLFLDRDVELKLGLPHISSVPNLRFNLLSRVTTGASTPGQYVVKRPLSGFAESIRAIRSTINLAAQDGPAQVIAVTSALPGEGKTTISACLGRISALADSRTLVIDCDIRRRRLSHALAGQAACGWMDILEGRAELQSALIQDSKTKLDVLSAGKNRTTTRDVFGTKAFTKLIDDVREQYDLIILDCPPVLAVAESMEIASRADAVVFTTLWGKTRVPVLRNALGILKRARANVLGVVLNNVNLRKQARYGEGNYGSYYNAYKKYYVE